MLLTTTTGQILAILMLTVATFGGWLARDVSEAVKDANGIPEDFPNESEPRDMFGNREIGEA